MSIGFYSLTQITHVIDMLCVIRHSHLLASLSDYVTLMIYIIVFHLKAISNEVSPSFSRSPVQSFSPHY